jgi:hypothetical protein
MKTGGIVNGAHFALIFRGRPLKTFAPKNLVGEEKRLLHFGSKRSHANVRSDFRNKTFARERLEPKLSSSILFTSPTRFFGAKVLSGRPRKIKAKCAPFTIPPVFIPLGHGIARPANTGS